MPHRHPRRRTDQPQRSSTPPPSPMPPGQRRRGDQRHRSPSPPRPISIPDQDIFDLLDRAVADGRLEESQRDNLVLAFLNPELSVEDLSVITSSFSLPQPTLRGGRETNASKKLLDSTTLDKSSITKASSSLLQSPSCEDTGKAVNHDTIKVSSPSSQNTPPVYALKPTRLNFQYYVRVDRGGSVHTYPALSGSFRSLEDAQDAINSHHAEQCKMMCMKGLSQMERGIRRALYWPNGLRRNSAEALAFMKNLRPEVELVRALLDKYNDDNELSGDLVYELIKVVGCEPIHERNDCSNRSYYHFNLVLRTKGADDSHGRINNLYFAEVAHMSGKFEESVLTFLRMLKPDDNGECFECCVDIKHPSDVEYKRGRPRIPMPGGMCPDEAARAYVEEFAAVYDESELKAQEARVRNEFKELYEPGFARVQEKYVVPARRRQAV